MTDAPARHARVLRLLEAARTLADPHSPPGSELRRRLLETTGLSEPNIEACLQRCLETAPSDSELQRLLDSTPTAPTAHVLLSANVFVAALRAIALGVASSARVLVRASRRDPALAEALHQLVPDLFQLVPRLTPVSGDRVWAYGSDETLRAVRQTLPNGAWYHPHGSGFGAVVLHPTGEGREAARHIAWDTALFDQRGCLSPRVVCVTGGMAEARELARQLARELGVLSSEVPAGSLGAEESAAARRHRDAAAYAFELFDARGSWVTAGDRFFLPPAGRNLHVFARDQPVAALSTWSSHLTSVATDDDQLRAALRLAFPRARAVRLGEMQRPPFDGPVDLRGDPSGELV